MSLSGKKCANGISLRENTDAVLYALVTSSLDFCNILDVTPPFKIVQTLQLMENALARLLTKAGCGEHILPALEQLRWLPVSFQTQFKVVALMSWNLDSYRTAYCSMNLHLVTPLLYKVCVYPHSTLAELKKDSLLCGGTPSLELSPLGGLSGAIFSEKMQSQAFKMF